MNTLFHAELSEREFSSHLLHVADLLAWAESKRLHLRTSPALDGFEFVQVEALLCAIERQTQDLTPDQAAEIVLNHPILKNDPVVTRYPDDVDPTTCRWLLGADAHKKWRELLSGAIEQHELTLLDFASKLPIDTAPAQSAATPAPVVAASATVALPKQRTQEIKILELLRDNGYDPLKLAQRMPGKPGPKAEIRTLALNLPALFTQSSFEKAWERLRNDGAVAGAE